MLPVNLLRTRRALLGSTVLAAGLLTGLVLPGTAHADISHCRTDPVVILNTGTVVDLTATVSTSATSVGHISYVLHGPVGTRPTQVIYTGGALTGKESFTYSADETSDVFDSDTLTTSLGAPFSVSVTTAVLSSQSSAALTLGYGAASGLSGQHLLVHVLG